MEGKAAAQLPIHMDIGGGRARSLGLCTSAGDSDEAPGSSLAQTYLLWSFGIMGNEPAAGSYLYVGSAFKQSNKQ